MAIKRTRGKVVLVCVLKNQRDLEVLLREGWYRMPVDRAPKLSKIKPDYLAFYQPAVFGALGKQIRYYGQVKNWQIRKRNILLPQEPKHPSASHDYFKVSLSKVKKLNRPICNIIPRRVSFGFTTSSRLFKAKNILQLYEVAPTEQIMALGLAQAGIKAVAQYYVRGLGQKYFLDFAVFCPKGAVAIECDNKKAHQSKRQLEKDQAKTDFLKKQGWIVLRLAEFDIVFNLRACIAKVKKAITKAG